MERIEAVPDQVFQLLDGWHCVVAGRVHGVWRDRGAALAGMATEQWRHAKRQHVARGLERAIVEGRALLCGCTTGGQICQEHAELPHPVLP
jgi:hypothetical protein